MSTVPSFILTLLFVFLCYISNFLILFYCFWTFLHMHYLLHANMKQQNIFHSVFSFSNPLQQSLMFTFWGVRQLMKTNRAQVIGLAKKKKKHPPRCQTTSYLLSGKVPCSSNKHVIHFHNNNTCSMRGTSALSRRAQCDLPLWRKYWQSQTNTNASSEGHDARSQNHSVLSQSAHKFTDFTVKPLKLMFASSILHKNLTVIPKTQSLQNFWIVSFFFLNWKKKNQVAPAHPLWTYIRCLKCSIWLLHTRPDFLPGLTHYSTICSVQTANEILIIGTLDNKPGGWDIKRGGQVGPNKPDRLFLNQ